MATYTLTLEMGEGVASFTGGGSYTGGKVATTVATAKEGYHLTKYTGENADGTGYNEWTGCADRETHTTTWTVNGNRYVKVHAEPNTYSIIYNANSGENAPAQQTFVYNENAFTHVSKEIPTREGFKFMGWATTANAEKATIQPGEEFSRRNLSMTIYAVWEQIMYVIAYDSNGGSLTPAAHKKTHGYITYLKDTIPYRPLHRFLGWATSRTSKVVAFAPGDKVYTDADLYLFAVWERVGSVKTKGSNAWENAQLWFKKAKRDWTKARAWMNDNGTWMPGGLEGFSETTPVKVPTSIAVTKVPDNNTVTIGEPIDLTGMEITATYSDGSTQVVTGWTYSPTVLNQLINPCNVVIAYTENGATVTTTHSMPTFT